MTIEDVKRTLFQRKSDGADRMRRNRRKAFDLPSTAYDWDDDQQFAFKGLRDGLGVAPLQAEQYINSQTDPAKPSGFANRFYQPDAPTDVELDFSKRLLPRLAGIDPQLINKLPFQPGKTEPAPPRDTLFRKGVDEPTIIQLSSQSGHALDGTGKAHSPVKAPDGALPLIKPLAAIGKDQHNKEQARAIVEKARGTSNMVADASPMQPNTMTDASVDSDGQNNTDKKSEAPDRFRWDQSGKKISTEHAETAEDYARNIMGLLQSEYDQHNADYNQTSPPEPLREYVRDNSKGPFYMPRPGRKRNAGLPGYSLQKGEPQAAFIVAVEPKEIDGKMVPQFRLSDRINPTISRGGDGGMAPIKAPKGAVGIVIYGPVSEYKPSENFAVAPGADNQLPYFVGRPDGSFEIWTHKGRVTEDGFTERPRSKTDGMPGSM